MKIVYLGRKVQKNNAPTNIEGDFIELLADDWDDFHYSTYFPTLCRISGNIVELGPIRLLIEDTAKSYTHLDQLRAHGWDGAFPISKKNYISVPENITFYEQLVGIIGREDTIKIARILKDASYMVKVQDNEDSKKFIATEAFERSLQRERGSVKAYLDGWRIFENQISEVLDLGFKFEDVYGAISPLNLKFTSPNGLPYDINVLIGPNGVGKSRVLHQMVEDWISPLSNETTGFVTKPNLSQVVVVSYSPFELFPTDLDKREHQDTDSYKYFGFRERQDGKISMSREFPRRNAAKALLSCLSDDKRYHSIRDWAQKIKTYEEVLKTAIDFEVAAVEVNSNIPPRDFYNSTNPPEFFIVEENGVTKHFIPISSDNMSIINENVLRENIIETSGVAFFTNKKGVSLSSGQRLFTYIVMNVLGAMQRNSLILIDEPELFLHPNLEIQFIDMLKEILERYNSKALLATHSVVTVREMPSECVHVFEKTEDGLFVKNPPFQTFGGDIQRISSYVFGDKAVSKPFERWIEKQLTELGSSDALLQKLGSNVNEEMLIQIKSMGRNQW